MTEKNKNNHSQKEYEFVHLLDNTVKRSECSIIDYYIIEL